MSRVSRHLPKTISNFARVNPNVTDGLTSEQVQLRLEANAVNTQAEGLTPTIPKIVLKNLLTLFNLINIALAVIIIIVGRIENTLFLGIVICNTAMGIFQEIRSKRTLDKLSVLAQTKVTVIRDGQTQEISQDELVLDDIVYLSSGDQICADAIILQSKGLEVDESLLTGESDRIKKAPGEIALSGSYVTSGHAFVQVTAVGDDNYANSLTAAAKQNKKNKSKLLQLLNLIIRVLTIIIIPLGLLLFFSNYTRGEDLQSSVLSAAAAMTGMIPGGLVLLTGVTLSVGAMNLARKKALVQSLPSIETLARVDVLCLDKTGTITDGSLVIERLETMEGVTEEQAQKAISELMGALQDTNSTAKALRQAYNTSDFWYVSAAVPFSSDRKWSGASFRGVGTYILGAPNVVFHRSQQPFIHQANRYASQGYRVLCLAHSDSFLQGDMLPDDLNCHALLLLTESLRKDAAATFQFFTDEGVILKVISGDNPRTVGAVAKQAGIEGAENILDMTTVKPGTDYITLVDVYTVFGHVTPQQKQELIRALQKNGHTTCMTGDGVNDILAMRESDCSVAMVGGSSAARNACDFVLLSQNFAAMTGVLREGRRVINNIERVASLYLVNTIYSVLFSIIYTLLPLVYPYTPLQLTPINALTVGIPSFFLALQPRYDRPANRFLSNILEHSVPAALTIVFNTLYLQLASVLFNLSTDETSTMVVFMIGVVGFLLLLQISKPYTRNIKIMLGVLLGGFLLIFIFGREIFGLESLFTRNVYFYLPLLYFSYHVHDFLGKTFAKIVNFFNDKRKKNREEEFSFE